MGKTVGKYLKEKPQILMKLSEAWRYQGPFTRWNRFRGAFPGLGIATIAFTIYCGYEYLFLKDDHHGHLGEEHGDAHSEGHGEDHW